MKKPRKSSEGKGLFPQKPKEKTLSDYKNTKKSIGKK